MGTSVSVQHGFSDAFREQAAILFDSAFGEKIAVAIPGKQARLKLFADTFEPSHALVAILDNRLLGIAGFKDRNGALTGGINYRALNEHLGFFGSLRAAAVLSLFERDLSDGELLMDGISVAPDARGQGVGTELLYALQDYAKKNQYQSIRLDVINTNPNAKRLYERVGFVSKETKHFPFLERILGFSASTTLEFQFKS